MPILQQLKRMLEGGNEGRFFYMGTGFRKMLEEEHCRRLDMDFCFLAELINHATGLVEQAPMMK